MRSFPGDSRFRRGASRKPIRRTYSPRCLRFERRQLVVEKLEERRLLSVTVDPSSAVPALVQSFPPGPAAKVVAGPALVASPLSSPTSPQPAADSSAPTFTVSAGVAIPLGGNPPDGSIVPLGNSLPDLIGYDPRPNNPTYYFHVVQASPSWGDQVQIDFAYLNQGASPSGSPTFSISFYISSDSMITTSDYLWGGQSIPGFTVPNANYWEGWSVTATLPASDPLSPLTTGPCYIGMILNPAETVAESNYANNSNQGPGKDLCSVTISPPVAVVTDSQGSPTDHAVNFGSIVNDGPGNAQAVQTVTLSDSAARSILKVPQNGISVLGGTSFHIVGINSNLLSQAASVSGGISYIAANNSETWTIQVAFDPVANGALTDTLQIQTDDPINPTIDVALTGTGTPVPNLVVTDSVPPANDQIVNFGNVGVGIGATAATATVTLTNNGSGPLTISQNGISVPSGPFSITGITSSTQGKISLTNGSQTIAAASAETWTINLSFSPATTSPATTGLVQAPLTILSNSPNASTSSVSLLGTGMTLPHLAVAMPPGSPPVNFGGVLADGPGKQLSTQTITLSNTGQLPLTINQNGITLATGTQFKIAVIAGIVSSTQGTINLSSGSATLAPNSTETWTVTLQFDPSTAEALSDTLRIASNDPVSPIMSVALTGTGLDQPALAVAQSATPISNLSFPATLNDGAGGQSSSSAIQLTNIGTQPLVVAKNGIQLLAGTNFQVVSIVSSASGTINLSNGSATIAPTSTETWTVTLRFDPLSTASLSDILRITSNDPVNSSVNVALSGQGVTPIINAVYYPTQAIHVSAGNAYQITWNGTYAPDSATYSVYYDTDRNPATGLVAIATGLPQSQTAYSWQVPTGLVGGTYTIYVTMQAGIVTSGGYAAGSLTVDAQGSDRLVSAPVTDQSAYTLSYIYNGTTYSVSSVLTMGQNVLYAVAAGAMHEYHVTLVPTLVDSESTGYDDLGNVTSTTDSAGEATQYTYDQLSRVTHIAYTDGTTVDYTYDTASDILTMHDSTGWQFYCYDSLNRLTSVTFSPTDSTTDPAALTIGYGYDLDNRLTSLTYPSGEVVLYAYDNASKLTSVTDTPLGQASLVTTYTYNSTTGLLATETRPDNVQTVYSYDTNGNVIDILNRTTSTQVLILDYHYTLDAAGRQTQVVMTTPSGATAQAYVYDDMNRLSQVTFSNSGTISSTSEVVQYTYDGNGNRLTQTTYASGIANGATQTLTYAYGSDNQLLTVTDQNGVVQHAYSYDWRGNEVEDVMPTRTTLYGYDDRNLMVSVADGTNYTTYQYDGAGRRISQTVNGVTTRFVVDPSTADYQTLEELTGAGAVGASYTYGLNRISGILPGQTASTYYLTDSLGSVGGLVSNTGASLGNYTYDVFGTILTSTTSVNNPYTFVGERFDQPTGLIDLRAREYDPGTGRFTSEDPLGIAAGTNGYIYCNSEPANSVDPLGTDSTGSILNTQSNVLDKAGQINGTASAGAELAQMVLSRVTKGQQLELFSEFETVSQKVSNVATNVLSKLTDTLNVLGVGITAAQLSTAIQQGDWLGGINLAGKTGLGIISAIPAFKWAGTVGDLVDWASSAVGAGIFNPSTAIANVNSGLGPQTVDTGTNPYSISASVGTLEDGFNQATNSGSELPSDSPDPGGVLIDQAATLVGSDINSITGATYDPTSNQLVFHGTNNAATLNNVSLGLFTTAIQAVYGSSGPPYVTLDPSAKLVSQTFDTGGGSGVIPNGQSVSLPIDYTPYTATNLDDMTLSFAVNGVPASARIDAEVLDGTNGTGDVTAGGRHVVLLELGTVTGLPSGVTMTQPTFPVILNGNITVGGTFTVTGGSGYTMVVNAQGQTSYFYFTINNSSGAAITVTNLQLVTDLQQRLFGGPINNSQLGWIMEEADRVMKELAGGKDQLTGAIYNSQNTSLPAGFENMLERYVANNQSGSFGDRFWFTPNQETLMRYIDPVTGEASVDFSQSTVQLNTEALLQGQPQDPIALAFANWFNANYAAMEQISFPVHDPTDPTGARIIDVPIFQELAQAMQAVALARFFHDNDIPLDTWWINGYTPPTYYTLATIPTLTNSLQNGAITVSLWGGVTIKTPNTYVPSAVAQAIATDVLTQRTPGTGDLAVQEWSVTGTPVGNFNAVAVSLDDQQQSGNINLGATDLSFPSPGGEQLAFQRYYNSSYLGSGSLGLGWQPNQFSLEFQYPSIEDSYGLMRDSGGNQVPIYGALSDTYLRSGEIRMIDQSTGQYLNFLSSLTAAYSLDGEGNPILSTSGLTTSDVPTFTAGQYTDGSTLTQSPSTHDYTLTHPDGSTLIFDPQGNLLSTTDEKGYSITYTYTNGQLTKISDTANQVLTVSYGSNGMIQYVAGPDNSTTPQRRISFVYDTSNRLIEVDTQALQSGTYSTASSTEYQYNSSSQISGVIGPNGVTTLTDAPDVKGRSTQSENAAGDVVDYGYTQNAATGSTTTAATNMGPASGNNPTAQGIAALKYLATGAASTTTLDSSARTTQTTDAAGDTTTYNYTGTSLVPSSVTLPTPGRPSISIQSNSVNLPTVINDPANTGGTPVQITYTAADLPSTETDAKGLVTKYTYTAWNDVATVTVGYGTSQAETTTYNYNANKLLQSVVDSLGHAIASYTYNSTGQVLTATDGDGVTTTYAYDIQGRLTQVYEPALTGAVNYNAYTYNDDNQVTQIATPTGNITYQYSATTHQLTQETDLTGSTTQYAYDPTSGLLTSVTQVHAGGNAVTQAVYDSRGDLVLLIAPNGDRTAFTSNALGQTTEVTSGSGTAPTATVSAQIASPTALNVNVTAPEPILVASIQYWQVGQPISTAVTQSVRLNDQSTFTIPLTGVDSTQHYNYVLTLTDGVGVSQTLPQAILDTGPTVATAASAAPSPANGPTTVLSVLGADFAWGAGNLTYTWAATSLPAGASAPSFSVNGSNAAQNTTATFSAWGTYGFTVTITDPSGLTATSSVNVNVNPIVVSGVSPNAGPLAGGTEVTIAGNSLGSAAAVFFGGTAAMGFSVVSAKPDCGREPHGNCRDRGRDRANVGRRHLAGLPRRSVPLRRSARCHRDRHIVRQPVGQYAGRHLWLELRRCNDCRLLRHDRSHRILHH
jgi:RHS repeat-associated protein